VLRHKPKKKTGREEGGTRKYGTGENKITNNTKKKKGGTPAENHPTPLQQEKIGRSGRGEKAERNHPSRKREDGDGSGGALVERWVRGHGEDQGTGKI